MYFNPNHMFGTNFVRIWLVNWTLELKIFNKLYLAYMFLQKHM